MSNDEITGLLLEWAMFVCTCWVIGASLGHGFVGFGVGVAVLLWTWPFVKLLTFAVQSRPVRVSAGAARNQEEERDGS